MFDVPVEAFRTTDLCQSLHLWQVETCQPNSVTHGQFTKQHITQSLQYSNGFPETVIEISIKLDRGLPACLATDDRGPGGLNDWRSARMHFLIFQAETFWKHTKRHYLYPTDRGHGWNRTHSLYQCTVQEYKTERRFCCRHVFHGSWLNPDVSFQSNMGFSFLKTPQVHFCAMSFSHLLKKRLNDSLE